MVNDLGLVNGVISLTYNLLVVKGPMTVGLFSNGNHWLFLCMYMIVFG